MYNKTFENGRHLFHYTRKVLMSKGVELDYNEIMNFCEFLHLCQSRKEFFLSRSLVTPMDFFIHRLSTIDDYGAFANLYNDILHYATDLINFIHSPCNDTAYPLYTLFKKQSLRQVPDYVSIVANKLTQYSDRQLSDDFLSTLEYMKQENAGGLYKLYEDNDLIYIGKSKNLCTRVIGSLKERGGNYLSYAMLWNMSDVNILEPYLIAKYSPPLNSEANTGQTPSFHLPEPAFTDLIPVYK